MKTQNENGLSLGEALDLLESRARVGLRVPFGRGTMTIQVRAIGQPITAAMLARVREYLVLVEEDLSRTGAAPLEGV